VLSLGFWLLHVRVETRHVHAERLLAKVGGSNRKPWGIPTLATRAQREWKGRSAAEVCTSEARKIGEWLAGARGDLPLAGLSTLLGAERKICREGVAGRKDPQRRVAEDAKAAGDREDNILPDRMGL